MFSIRTARGRLATAAIASLAFVLTACPGPDGGPTDDPTGAPSSSPSPIDDPEPSGSPSDIADPSDAASPTADGEATFVVRSFTSCHDHNSTGASSDGVLTVDAAPPGARVATLVEIGDGRTIGSEDEVPESGPLVVLLPLTSFGEIITLVGVEVDGQDIDLSTVGQTEYEVLEESDCTGHPDEG